MEADPTKTTKCLNCGTTFQGKHCPECGQSADTHRFTMKLVFKSLIDSLWGVDSKLGFTLKGLFTQPGKMTLSYIEGKRTNCYSPFSMLLKALTLYVLILSFTNGFDFLNKFSDTLSKDISADASATERIKHDLDILLNNGIHFFSDHQVLIYLLTLPLYVVAARICFGRNNRKRYNWAEYIIAMINPLVIVVLFRCAIKLLFPLIKDLSTLMIIFIPPFVVIMAISACLKDMMGFNTVKTIWRSLLTEVLYCLMIATIFFICVFFMTMVFSIRYQTLM